MTMDSTIEHSEIVATVPVLVLYAGLGWIGILKLVFDADHMNRRVGLTREVIERIVDKSHDPIFPPLAAMITTEFGNAGFDAINAIAKTKSKYPMRIFEYLAVLSADEQVACYLEARAQLLAQATASKS